MHLVFLFAALATSQPHLSSGASLQLDASFLAPVAEPTPAMQIIGDVLSNGILLPGEIHLGADGQPAMPFLNAYFFSQEIRGPQFISAGGQVDALALAQSLMATARVEF